MSAWATKRRRQYKKLKQKLKEIEKLKRVQCERTLTPPELDKIEKEKQYLQQLNTMYIDPTNKGHKPAPSNITAGSYAFLKDLVQCSQCNGKVVKILQYLQVKRRWKVRILPYCTSYFLVKAKNLSPIEYVADRDNDFNTTQAEQSTLRRMSTQELLDALSPKKAETVRKKPRKQKRFSMLYNNLSNYTPMSMKDRCLLLISGYVHLIHLDANVAHLIYRYLPTKIHIHVTILRDDDVSEEEDDDEDAESRQRQHDILNGTDYELTMHDSVKLLHDKINARLMLCDGYLWFRFGEIRSLLYPYVKSPNEDNDRLVEIPSDEEENIKLGHIAINTLHVRVSLNSRYNEIQYRVAYDYGDIHALQIGDILKVFSARYGWRECVIKFKKQKKLYLHYIGRDPRYDEVISIHKLIRNGMRLC